MALLDSETVEIPCPHCSRKQRERIGKLKTNPTLTCAGCGQRIKIEADDLRKKINDIERSIAKLRDSFGKLGKR